MSTDAPWKEALDGIVADLRDRNDATRIAAAQRMRSYILQQSREMSGESFGKFLADVNRHVFELVNSSSNQDKIGGITAISELIDMDYAESAGTKITRLANYIRIGLSSADTVVMTMASQALGRLARASDTLTAECVEFEIDRALKRLRGERMEHRRHGAVLVLKELANNAPTLFYAHVNDFISLVWVALRDPKLPIRLGAVDALRSALEVVQQRESRLAHKWYESLYSEALSGLKNSNSDWIHASVLALGQLLTTSGHFLQPHFTQLCDTVLVFRDHKDKKVRNSVVALMPLLAQSCEEVFVQKHLNTCMQYLLTTVKRDADKGSAFLAMGNICMTVGSKVKPYTSNLMDVIRSSLNGPSGGKGPKSTCAEALTCVSMIAKGVPQYVSPHMGELLPLMMQSGLSQRLVDALTQLCESIPAIVPAVQMQLLDMLSTILSGEAFKRPGAPDKRASVASFDTIGLVQVYNIQTHTGTDQSVIRLALHTLGCFDFRPHALTEFVRECVVNYLDDDEPLTRKQAALTCTSLIAKRDSVAPVQGHAGAVVGEVLEKLLIVGIADPDPHIRFTVLESLDSRFDHHLAQAENLRSLFIALNDEEFRIRELAIHIIGRLTIRNPAYVMPSLRKTLIQLLTELEFSGDSRNKEESAILLGHLVRAAQQLIRPYVDTILKALLPKLRDGSGANVVTSVLSAIGELSVVSGDAMLPHVDSLMPLIIETLQDQSSCAKRQIAMRTLGRLVESTGYVIEPLLRYPQLLGIILSAIQTETEPCVRIEVIRALGILGALDPYRYKVNQQHRSAPSAQSDVQSGSEGTMSDLSPSSESYYPTVVIAALMRILKDPSLSSQHTHVIHAIMFIFKSVGSRCVPFLPQIMPPFLQTMTTCESGFRDFMFQQLGVLVSVVKQHIRDYLDDIFALVKQYWHSKMFIQILALVEQISNALNDEFKVFLPDLIPQMLEVLHSDRTPRRTFTQKVLHALEVFGTNLDDYLHLLIPAVVKLFEQPDAPMAVRALAFQTTGRLCDKLNFSDYASRIIHPLARVLAKPDLQELREDAMATLCQLVYQLASDYVIFIPMVNKIIATHHIHNQAYETLVSQLLKNQPLERVHGPSDAAGAKEGRQRSRTEMSGAKKYAVDVRPIMNAAEASEKTTKEDWSEWLRKLSVVLVQESSSPAVRSCLSVAQTHDRLARDLFNAAFFSCWTEMGESDQLALVKCLEQALLSDSIPPEILQALLNLAEFMEHDDKPLPIDVLTLGTLAKKCRAYAKALHYKEIEFSRRPERTIEELISVNNQLQQPDAAVGILLYAQRQHKVQLQESWYEKLGRWEDALEAYERTLSQGGGMDTVLGKMRCLHALGEWDLLSQMSGDAWSQAQAMVMPRNSPFQSPTVQVAPLAAAAAWHMGKWDDMQQYVSVMDADALEGAFFRSILCIHHEHFDEAQQHIDRARHVLDTELTALVGESYNRAYQSVVRVQQLSELEEVIEYKRNPLRRESIQSTWRRRLRGCQRNVEVWQKVLAVHSLVVPPRDDEAMWLKFASLCRKSRRLRLANQTLSILLSSNEDCGQLDVASDLPHVHFAALQLKWSGGAREEALQQLKHFTCESHADQPLMARCYLTLAQWQMEVNHDSDSVSQVLQSAHKATQLDPNWYKAWHTWALVNFEAASCDAPDDVVSPDAAGLHKHVLPAIRGFLRSIALSPDRSLQDTLRLLTLWFKYGAQSRVEDALDEGFGVVSIDNWLQVIPQIIARIHSPVHGVQRLIKELLSRVGEAHPQALVYPLTVASKSPSQARVEAANCILESIRTHSRQLVEQALLVSNELIRVAILWHEIWHEGLEEASRLYFGDHNIDGMLSVLEPLHLMLENGPTTLREISFQQTFGRDLQEASEWCRKYRRSGNVGDLNQAWDLYYHVFRKVDKQLPQMKSLELQYVAPELLHAEDLELAVPGTYVVDAPVIRIRSFAPVLRVIKSKQRPRKLSIFGSDGVEYPFLLKGHEDLRQDERVMQLFGLVNTLLDNDSVTSKNHLRISRYSAIPLSPNSGIIEWVPQCDTLHALVKQYRDSRRIPLDAESKAMMKESANFNQFTLLQKVHAFERALDESPGRDLERVLWLKSRNSEVWLDRRTNYTRSLAVMSMVGYILGLGDRHPSNLMLERRTGKIIHIDFGDCFEVAMDRDKYPEKVPFRLTRMLVNAMEVSGIEGNFRLTCVSVMRVLRDNKDSLMAVLEAFVHDPLINWRLLTPHAPSGDDSTDSTDVRAPAPSEAEERPPVASAGAPFEPETLVVPEALNQRALDVVTRISNKLTGRDFVPSQTLQVSDQVEKLINQATSHLNLAQHYAGWCPWW